ERPLSRRPARSLRRRQQRVSRALPPDPGEADRHVGVRDGGVTIGSMTLGPVPKGATVRLSCAGCHGRRTFTAKRTTVSLEPLRGKLLKRRTSFTATVTKPGFIG